MCLVEQTLNSRPLKPVRSDVNDLEAIKPNHFLLGNTNLCLLYLPYAEDFDDYRKILSTKTKLLEPHLVDIPRVSANFEQ